MKPQAVVLYVQNQFGNVLTITRKDNHNSFGLVGGKVDSTDNTPRDALNREVFEETGVDISKVPTELSFPITDYSNPNKPVLIEAFVLPVGTESLFPKDKVLTPEGTYMQFLPPLYLNSPERSEFWEYNTELYSEIKAYLGV